MARREQDRSLRCGAPEAEIGGRLRRIGRLCRLVGLSLCGASLLIAAASGVLIVDRASSAAVDELLAILTASASGLAGVEFVFHVAALGALAGCWLLGLGLVLDGLFDESP